MSNAGDVDETEDQDRVSRTDAKKAQREFEDALARLSKDLVALADRKLEQLGLPEAVLDEVRKARAISSPPARNRQLRMVRSALRSDEWAAIRTRLDALLVHGVVPGAPARPGAARPAGAEAEWTVRLVGGGAEELESLLREYPKADRSHLRQLIRNVQKASAERRKKAEQKLANAIRSVLRG
jgi:ribosome-associated protein